MSEDLLGKKRDQNIDSPKKKTEEEKSEKKTLFGSAPEGSLFGNLKSGSLFGNKDESGNEKKPLFWNFSFSNNTNSTFLKEGSLFSDPNLTKGSSLFSTFNNNLNEKLDNEEEEVDDDEICPSNEKENFKPSEAMQAVDSEYNRLYSKQINNFYILNSEEVKFISKGKGIVSIEQHKEKTENYHVVFRNSLGIVIFNGFLMKHLKLAEKITKNYKNISAFASLEIKDKPILRLCRIPFDKEEELEEFNKQFNNVINCLKEEKEKDLKQVEKKEEKEKEEK
jgi:hypothetical protein